MHLLRTRQGGTNISSQKPTIAKRKNKQTAGWATTAAA